MRSSVVLLQSGRMSSALGLAMLRKRGAARLDLVFQIVRLGVAQHGSLHAAVRKIKSQCDLRRVVGCFLLTLRGVPLSCTGANFTADASPLLRKLVR